MIEGNELNSMAIKIDNLLIIGSITIAVAVIIFLLFYIISSIRNRLGKSKSKQEASLVASTNFSGCSVVQLDRIFQYGVYVLIFQIVLFVLLFSFYTIGNGLKLADIWPFLFFVIILIYLCIATIERTELPSERRPQKDLRRY
jgi:small-conductance mechanosensitive channel